MGEETILDQRKKVLSSGRKAVDELIKVIESKILESKENDNDIAADKMKNAAAAKKLAIFDALDILSRISEEEDIIREISESGNGNEKETSGGFAERNAH